MREPGSIPQAAIRGSATCQPAYLYALSNLPGCPPTHPPAPGLDVPTNMQFPMLGRTWRCASRGLSTPRLHSCLLGRVLLMKIHILRKGFLLGAGHAGSDSWHPAPARHTLTFARGTTYQLCFLLERCTFLSTVLHRSFYQRVACCWEMAGMRVELPRGVRPHSFSRPGVPGGMVRVTGRPCGVP